MATEVQSPGPFQKEDDLTLRDILLNIQSYLKEIGRNWRLMLIITIPIFAYLMVMAFITPKKFSGELTFMVNEDEGSKVGGVADVLESLGVVGSSNNSEYNLDKILELAKSQRILFKSLMSTGTVKEKEDYFANHLIRVYNLHKVWKKDKPKLANFYFTRDSLENFSRLENSALKYLYKMMLGQGDTEPLLTTTTLENSGIMSMTLKTRNEQLSVQLLKDVFDRLSLFYIEQTTNKQRETYEKVSAEADSIRTVLKSKEYELASFIDKNQGLITQRAQLKKEQIEREVFILNTMYGEAVSNEEVAKFTLKNRTPFIQAVDEPVVPLKQIRPSKFKNGLTGILLGVVLTAMFVVGRRLYRETIDGPDSGPNQTSSEPIPVTS